MVRATVKKGKRLLLEIGDDLCRYYPEGQEMPRSFPLREITQVERCDNRKEPVVYLRNAADQILAEFELYNTDGGTQALRFFRDCSLKKLTDEKGQLLPSFEILVTEKEPTEKEKQLRAENKKEREKRKEIKNQWAATPLFYETPEWLHRIRLISRGVLLLGILSFFHIFTLPYERTAVSCIIWPILIWIFYLCFHRIMVWDLHVNEDYIVPPFALLALFGVVIFLKGGVYNLAPGQLWKLLLFAMVLFVILLLPFLWLWNKEKQWLESWKAPVIYILAYSLVISMAWNICLTFEAPKYETAVVQDKSSVLAGYKPRMKLYHVTVETESGRRLRSQIHSGLYEQTEVGDEVVLRWETSVFGITYYQLQSEITGE